MRNKNILNYEKLRRIYNGTNVYEREGQMTAKWDTLHYVLRNRNVSSGSSETHQLLSMQFKSISESTMFEVMLKFCWLD